MKKFNLILLFSFFLLMPNVYADYYLIPNTFTLEKEGSQLNPDFDFYGVNNGIMTSIYTLDGNSNTWYQFELSLDGSNCSTNIDSENCTKTINDIQNGGLSNTIFGSFQMCVSKPQFHFSIDWNTCNNNCLTKSQNLIIIQPFYQTCTLGLYNTETGGTLENDGYLVNVYIDIAKWEYVQGAYSTIINGNIYLHNDSDSILYYKFVNNVYLSDLNMASMNSGFGVFNHDYSNPDVGGETFLNNGTCVKSYNQFNVYKYSNNWNRTNDTFTFNTYLQYEKISGGKNLNFTPYKDGTLKNTNGIKFEVDSIGQVIVNNTATNNAFFYFHTYDYEPYFNLSNGIYYLSGCPSGGSNNKYFLRLVLYNNNNPVATFTDYGHGVLVDTRSYTYNRIFLYIQISTGYSADNLIFQPMIESGSSKSLFMPYGGYYIEFNDLDMDIGVFHYYDTNLNKPNNIYIYLEDYEGDTKLLDMVNCKNSYVCKYENYLSFTNELLNTFNPKNDRINNLKFYFTGNEDIYFNSPFLYDLYDVPGRATWKPYYQPYGEYICSDNETGIYYNAQNKNVYYNPDNPPNIVSSNPNGQSQNIFGIEVDFYGLSSLFSIPVDIYNDIKNGSYNNCQPLQIPFPGFPDKYVEIPCITDYFNSFPDLLNVIRIILMGILSLKVGIGTINWVKKWYDATIMKGDVM